MDKASPHSRSLQRKIVIFITLPLMLVLSWLFLTFSPSLEAVRPVSLGTARFFEVQSIDTMKFSRDMARTKLNDASFDQTIDAQVRLIRDAHATHVAIDTPYDEEFVPMLSRWVAAARKYGLSVWFRGNFSGWEGWFDYPKIDRDEHVRIMKLFIARHGDLFADGDIFSPCPECENGGPGDPRQTGDKDGFNGFLVREYDAANSSFHAIGKKVTIYSSMNSDIAEQVITPETAAKLGGTILIDHYDRSAEGFADTIMKASVAAKSSIGIGEFGAPIDDLNGKLNEAEQADFVKKTLDTIIRSDKKVDVVDYWTLAGGTTALIRDDDFPKPAYSIVSAYYSPHQVQGRITDPSGWPVRGVLITTAGSEAHIKSNWMGFYSILTPAQEEKITFEKPGFAANTISFDASSGTTTYDIVLDPSAPTLWYKLRLFLLR